MRLRPTPRGVGMVVLVGLLAAAPITYLVGAAMPGTVSVRIPVHASPVGACEARQFAASLGAATGSPAPVLVVLLRNTGRPCVLRGAVDVMAVDGRGHQRRLSVPGTTAQGTVGTDGSERISLAAPTGCRTRPAAGATLAFGPVGGQWVRMRCPATLRLPDCPVRVTASPSA